MLSTDKNFWTVNINGRVTVVQTRRIARAFKRAARAENKPSNICMYTYNPDTRVFEGQHRT